MAVQAMQAPAFQQGLAEIEGDWAVDGCRGLAALLVMLAHYGVFFSLPADLITLSTTGVDWFFVLSGYVFAPALLGRKPLKITPFFVRRFFRIIPLYVLALLVYAGIRLLGLPPTLEPGFAAEFAQNFLLHLFFLHTLATREIAFYFNPAFWSLPPEVAFYLLVPVLGWAARQQERNYASSGVWFFSILVLAVVMRIQISGHLPADPATVTVTVPVLLSFHLPGLLCEFLLGSLAWLFVQRQPGLLRRLLCAAIAVLMLVVLGMVFAGAVPVDAENSLIRGISGLWAAAAYALLAVAFFGWLQAPPGWLRSAALQLGFASYGIYLFHNAAPQLLALAGVKTLVPTPVFGLLAVLLTLAVSVLLHTVCEAPMRRRGRHLAQRLG